MRHCPCVLGGTAVGVSVCITLPKTFPLLQRMAAAAGGATEKKDDDASSMSMMMGIQMNTLIDFHVLTEEQLNGILNQINHNPA